MVTPEDAEKMIRPLSMKRVLKTWLPLLASWLLMSMGIPLINAIIARLENPEINLAAFGGVVFPISLTIEAPIIMLLAASTALSRDWISYKRLRKITLVMGLSLSALHLIIAVTPLYDFIVNVILDVPPEVVEPGRLGLIAMTPWTFAIAYRRFQQGAMIRFNHSKMVGETTIIRFLTTSLVLAVGMMLKTIPGALLGGLSQGIGVTVESLYTGLRVRKILPEIKAAPLAEKPLTLKRYVSFYVPLILTSSVWLLWMPIISAAVSRMPDPLESLAVWSVLTGLLFAFRSPGVAYNEAVVALLEEPRSYPVLRKFTWLMSLITVVIASLVVLTPFSSFWFKTIANLPSNQAEAARGALGMGIPLTIFSLLIHFYQGIIVNLEKTRAVAEAVGVFMVALAVVLVIGVVMGSIKGIYIASAAFTFAHIAQAVWLWIRSRKPRKQLAAN